MHWGPYFEENRYELTDGSSNGEWADDFHLWVLEWDADHIEYVHLSLVA